MNMSENIDLRYGDCLEIMPNIPSKSVDMILCDLPYGTVSCKWDIVIPFDLLWEQYERIIKDNGAIVLSASQPFTTDLISSNRRLFRYEMIWEKSSPSGFLNAQKMPNKCHENILVFYKNLPVYNPIKYVMPDRYIDKRSAKARLKGKNDALTKTFNISGKASKEYVRKEDDGSRLPDSILCFNSEWGKNMHPTQKPLSLFEYLIKTYTNEGDLVLDNCLGSGTTAIACHNLKRRCIGIEKEFEYFEIAKKRVQDVQRVPLLFSV
jgi:site-specific DNA-methyltransferase (adenine-specific)